MYDRESHGVCNYCGGDGDWGEWINTSARASEGWWWSTPKSKFYEDDYDPKTTIHICPNCRFAYPKGVEDCRRFCRIGTVVSG